MRASGPRKRRSFGFEFRCPDHLRKQPRTGPLSYPVRMGDRSISHGTKMPLMGRFWNSVDLTGNQTNTFKKAKKNFKNPYDQTAMESSVPEGSRYEGDGRMVLNLRYRPASLAMKPSGRE